MPGSHQSRIRTWILAGTAILIFCGVCKPEQQPPPPVPEYNLIVVVKEVDSDQPISQARLTLIFRQPGKLHHTLSYSAKTNTQGQYKFTNIPKGTVRLMVTAERHQSFGREFDLAEDNQVFEVKLKKPQPLL